jgi:hypothetical protein
VQENLSCNKKTTMQNQTTTQPVKASMWINDYPAAVEYLRSTSWHGKLRARLPAWLGGRPAMALDTTIQDHQGGLVSYKTGEPLSLLTKKLLAESHGRKAEAASINQRMQSVKEARSQIRRVS